MEPNCHMTDSVGKSGIKKAKLRLAKYVENKAAGYPYFDLMISCVSRIFKPNDLTSIFILEDYSCLCGSIF